jgi:hypothetical protein
MSNENKPQTTGLKTANNKIHSVKVPTGPDFYDSLEDENLAALQVAIEEQLWARYNRTMAELTQVKDRIQCLDERISYSREGLEGISETSAKINPLNTEEFDNQIGLCIEEISTILAMVTDTKQTQ